MALEGKFAELHDPAAQLRLQRQLVPDLPGLVPFIRPAFYALLLSPLSLFSLRTAFWLWLFAQSSVTLACTAWAVRAFSKDAAVYASLYAPMALSIAHGQDAPLLLAIVVLAFVLAKNNRPWAGAVLSLGLIKFHLFALWPFLLAAQKRWRMLGWFGLGAGTLAGVSFLLSGLNGFRLYYELLASNAIPLLSPSPDMGLNIRALLLNLGLNSPVIYCVVAFSTAIIAVLAARGAPLWKLFALATSGSLLITPHVYRYDATLLLLPIWCGIFVSSRPITKLAATAACLVPILALLLLQNRPPYHGVFPLLLVSFLLAVSVDVGAANGPASGRDGNHPRRTTGHPIVPVRSESDSGVNE